MPFGLPEVFLIIKDLPAFLFCVSFTLSLFWVWRERKESLD